MTRTDGSPLGLVASVTMTALLALLAVGCGTQEQFSSEGDPAMDLRVDNKSAPTGSTCTLFQPDTTRGQTKYHKSIVIKNVSTDATKTPLPLCLKWTVQDSNSQLKITPPASPPSNTKCADAKAGLGSNVAISFDIEYAPNESGDSEPIKITFESNDPKQPVKTLCFGIAKVGAIPVLEPSECVLSNVTQGSPQPCCFKLLNAGNAPLAYKGAGVDPENAQWVINAQPNADAIIEGKGTPENTDGSKSLQICVKYSPDSTPDNEKATLVVSTNAQPGEVKAAMDAKSEAQATFKVDCSEATGKKIFSFPDPVKASAKCKICNEGPPPLKLQNVEVKAYVAAQKDDAKAAFDAKLVDITGAKQNIYAVSMGKCVDIVVDYTPPATGAGPASYVGFSYSSVGVSNQGSIPIVAGGCDAAQPDFGPAKIFAQAAVGETWTGTLAIANQTCGALALTNVCPYDGTYQGKDPCTSAPSKHFTLAKGFATTTLPGYGMLALDVVFKPANGNKKTINDALLVQYCPGTYASGKCSVEPVSRIITLAGTVAFETTPKPPTATTALITPAAGLLAGKPVTVALSVQDPGGFKPDAMKFHWWTISKRPEGSATWLSDDDHGTTGNPVLSIVPDLPGEYEISGQVQMIDAANQSIGAYSPQAKVTFTVK